MDSDVEAVRDALTALDEAFERRDLQAALNVCTDDVVFIGSGDGEEVTGRDGIIPMFNALAPQLEHSQFTFGGWESVAIDVLGDVAVLYAWGPAELTTPNRRARFRYRLTGVLLRRNGGWLWRVHHGSEPGAW